MSRMSPASPAMPAMHSLGNTTGAYDEFVELDWQLQDRLRESGEGRAYDRKGNSRVA